MLPCDAANALRTSSAALFTRAVLALAVAAAAALAPYLAADAAGRIGRSAGRGAVEREAEVIRGLRLDPAVLAQLAEVVPQSATYDVSVGEDVDDVRGQAFAAWVGHRLLPRIRVADGTPADWSIRWGATRRGDDERLVRRIPGNPPVLVLKRG